MVFSNKSEFWGFLSLSLFASGFLFLGLGTAPLIDWDENIYAEASRQMVERQDYLNIYINDHPFAEKPPFFFWEQSLSYHIFGVSEFAARFPSALAGVLSVWICFFVGRKLHSFQLGMLWGGIYLTGFLPALLARSAVIDHTFNFFIMLSTYSLYLYDVHYGQSFSLAEMAPKKKHMRYWGFLTLASLAMGFGVLTKGPLGGVIPLVGYGVYKWFCRRPRISWFHFCYCGLLSLVVALSWYLVNGWIYGFRFIVEFIQFQQSLFSKPLEGHHGPFYYHFVVAVVGLFPWTPFLFIFKRKHFSQEHPHIRPLLLIGLGWVVFVLILFSIVTTKLPHYSASLYIPLSFVVALCLERAIRLQIPIARWILGIYFLMGSLFSGLLLAFPFLLEDHFTKQGIFFNIQWPMTSYLTGISLFLGIAISSFLFWKKKIWVAFWVTALTLLISTQGMWRYQVPLYLQYVQQPLLGLIQKAYQNEGKVVFYRYVSFAALFYGKQPIEMLHTYKFPGNPKILDRPQASDIFVITERKNKKHLQKDHPLVEFVEDRGTFSLLFLPREAKDP